MTKDSRPLTATEVILRQQELSPERWLAKIHDLIVRQFAAVMDDQIMAAIGGSHGYRQAGTSPHGGAGQASGHGPGTAFTVSVAPGAINYAPRPAGLPRKSPGMNEPADADLPYAGVTVGELIGWRCWRLGLENDGTIIPPCHKITDYISFAPRDCASIAGLFALGFDVFWPPDAPLEAVDMEGDFSRGRPIGYGYGPGIYAHKDPETMFALLAEWERLSPLVFGSVYLWGEVVEHRDGYRAQFAKVRSLEQISSSRRHFVVYPQIRVSDANRNPMMQSEHVNANYPLLLALRKRYGVEENAAET